MRSFLYDSAPLHHDDPVGEADQSQPMSDDQSGPFGGRTLQGFNHQLFRLRVQAAGRLIQNQDGGLRRMARAIAMRCFCPPESVAPPSAIGVS